MNGVMKKFFSTFLLIVLASTLMLVGTTKPSTAGPAPTGEIVYAVGDLGAENFEPLGLAVPFWIGITNERWMRFQYNTEKPGFYPVLAKKWEFAPDYSYLDVYIRKGVQWQGGWGELTAEDFQYSFLLHKDEEAGSSEAGWFAPPDQGGFIKSTEVIDPYHWRINLSALPVTSWFAAIATNYVCVMSKKYCEKVGMEKAIQEPIGTGPWQLIEHVPGSYMKFKAFDKYWGEKPDFQYLTIKRAPDEVAQIAMLKTGEADLVDITADKMAEVKAAGFQVKKLAENTGQCLEFGGQLLSSDPKFDPTVPWAAHTDEPAGSDWNQRALKVRKALNLAVNRASIREKILNGACTPMTTYFYAPSMRGYKSKWKEYPYDVARAKQLLKEAGYPNGFAKPITMYIDSDIAISGPKGSDVAATVADDLEALGLKVKRQKTDIDAFNTLWQAHEGAWSMVVVYYPVFWTPGQWWEWQLASNAMYHDAFMHSDFDEIVTTYSSAANKSTEDQTRILQKGTDWIYKNYMFAPIAYQDRLIAMSPKIGGLSQYEVYWVGAPSALNFEFFTHGK
jgi:ABC-type transport system substrate-binding protein